MLLHSLQSPMQRNALIAYYALVTPGDHVLVWIGSPGIGKTYFARSVGHAIGVDDDHFHRDSLGQCGIEDLNGWPTPTADGLVLYPKQIIRKLDDGRPAIWFIDEFSNAPRSVQAGALKLIDSRICGDRKLNKNLHMMAAMNPPETAADYQDIPKAMWNRIVAIQFENPSAEDHVRFMQGDGAVNVELPEFDVDAFHTARAEVVAIYTAFMTPPPYGMGLGTLIEDCTSDQVMSRFPMSFATPRSWDYALNLAATCRMFGDWDAMLKLMAGVLGEPQALQFIAFLRDQDLVPIIKLRQDVTLWNPDPKRPDRTFAQLMAVALAATDKRLPEKERGDWWHWGWEVIRITLDAGAGDDLALVAGQHLGAHKPKGKLLAEYVPVIQRLAPMVAAAGFGE